VKFKRSSGIDGSVTDWNLSNATPVVRKLLVLVTIRGIIATALEGPTNATSASAKNIAAIETCINNSWSFATNWRPVDNVPEEPGEKIRCHVYQWKPSLKTGVLLNLLLS